MRAPIPANEEQRLAALRRYEILDTIAEQAYDDITLLAAHIAQTPMAVISLIDRDRQWFKSKVGISGTETPRELAFCAHTILTPHTPLLVPDATLEGRFADNGFVTGPPHVRFYFGVPLVTSDDFALGTLCAIDSTPRLLSDNQIQALTALSRQVIKLLELRRNAVELRLAWMERDAHACRLEVMQESLERAKQEAQAANRAKSEFLANMSHDIRTPISGIIGMTELALESPLSAEQRDYLENVKLSADSLLVLINDILDLSKVEAGKLELDAADVDLRAFLGDLAKIMTFAAHRKGLRLGCDIAAGVPDSVLVDGPRLRQILINLIGNAIKFTPSGEVSVAVSGAASGGSAELTFSVRDTGPGIPLEKQQLVFEAFAQADSSVFRKSGGTGLGLAISKRLVEAMGGTIRLESEVGRGSTFSFTVPLKLSAAPRRESAPAEAPSAPDAIRPLSILLADNPVIQKVVHTILTRRGHSVELARNGQEALDAAGRQSFDLALMDVEMPELDGWEATAEIRRRETGNGRRLPILAMTAHAMAGDEARCLAAGMDGYLAKPVRQDELWAAVARLCGSGLSIS